MPPVQEAVTRRKSVLALRLRGEKERCRRRGKCPSLDVSLSLVNDLSTHRAGAEEMTAAVVDPARIITPFALY
jgi:predicted PP-loop superfamily ATPase